ncbi:deoxycytidylate deaminase [Martelella soudanensis]|uniref:deoxycytidylate deaminase n=1 Tax=unclassified Martelella TaxID=2629616 RepID=UPI001FEE61DD|nr:MULTISPECIES: deaminase [unclassified Martelella]
MPCAHPAIQLASDLDRIEKLKLHILNIGHTYLVARFHALCDETASRSEDRDFKIGAVIVGPGHEVRATGYNGLPRGVGNEDATRFDRASGEKFFWIEHAERNAIYNAARSGAALAGCTIYVNRFPCADCARAIIQSGIVCADCRRSRKTMASWITVSMSRR